MSFGNISTASLVAVVVAEMLLPQKLLEYGDVSKSVVVLALLRCDSRENEDDDDDAAEWAEDVGTAGPTRENRFWYEYGDTLWLGREAAEKE